MERVLSRRLPLRAFSLLELLVVMAILVGLLALGSVGISSVLSGSELQRAGGGLQDAVSRARQIATSRSESVELRFYEEEVEGTSVWNAFQLWATPPTGSAPIEITRYERLPARLVIDPTRSPLLMQGGVSGPSGGESPQRPNSYRGFRFRGDGSIQVPLDAAESYVTVIKQSELGGGLPSNFVVLQVMPQTGRAETFQPTGESQ